MNVQQAVKGQEYGQTKRRTDLTLGQAKVNATRRWAALIPGIEKNARLGRMPSS